MWLGSSCEYGNFALMPSATCWASGGMASAEERHTSAGGPDDKGCWSGCCAVDQNGVPVILYTGVRCSSLPSVILASPNNVYMCLLAPGSHTWMIPGGFRSEVLRGTGGYRMGAGPDQLKPGEQAISQPVVECQCAATSTPGKPSIFILASRFGHKQRVTSCCFAQSGSGRVASEAVRQV